MTKEDKALEYAKEAWGVYFDDKHPDSAIEYTCGEITQSDYLAGYRQGIKDSELLESVSELIKELEFHGYNHSTAINNARQLIKQTKFL